AVSLRWLATGSRSSTRIAPASAASRPHISRMVVVLPAPSGPIRPNISPRSTDSDSASTAVVRPYRFVTPSRMIAGITASLLQRDLGFHGHPRLEDAAAIVDRHLHAVHELRALVRRLHVARRELRFLRDVAERSGDAAAGGGNYGGPLPQAPARHRRLLDPPGGP